MTRIDLRILSHLSECPGGTSETTLQLLALFDEDYGADVLSALVDRGSVIRRELRSTTQGNLRRPHTMAVRYYVTDAGRAELERHGCT